VHQDEWDSPDCAAWALRLGAALERCSAPVVLAAHSAACPLVAPSDPAGPNYPNGPTGFNSVPRRRLPFASIVVAVTNDPYVELARAREYAAAWGAALVVLENAGHINVASGFGPWPQGFDMLAQLRAGTGRASRRASR
jgi:predicted alpha/beta hydrolase family esterase